MSESMAVWGVCSLFPRLVHTLSCVGISQIKWNFLTGWENVT